MRDDVGAGRGLPEEAVMLSVHFSQRTLEKFLRAELTRPENAEVVRHLLAQCQAKQGRLQ